MLCMYQINNQPGTQPAIQRTICDLQKETIPDERLRRDIKEVIDELVYDEYITTYELESAIS